MKTYSKYRFHVARIIACAALVASLSNCSDDATSVATTPTNTSSTQPLRITYEHPMPPPVRIAGMAGFGLAGAAVCSDQGFVAIILGSTWRVLNTGRSVNFNAVWGTSPNDFYVVGDRGCVLHWDGAAFTDIDTGYSDEFTAVWGAGTDDVWFCARSILVHWDGAAATPYESPALPSGTYYAIHGSSSTNVYAVGFNGLVARWDGASWSSVTTGLVATTLNAVFVTGDEVFIGGSNKKLWHYDGTSWSSFTATTSSAFDDFSVVTGTGASAVYALGQARLMYRWDGTNWSDFSDPFFNSTYNFFSGYAYGVGLATGGDYNAASSNVAIYNSVSWAPLSDGVASDALWDVWTFDANHAYAVGDGGTILERDAAGWSNVTHGLTTESLYTVWASSGSNVYAAGEGGVVVRFDGSSWAPVNTGLGTVPLYDISGQGPNDTWIVGSEALWHWDGVT
ncbi:MAG: hypothetical protein L0Z51_02240 [Candidatus Latescibacteria bacterium]|nr:hypothetical protein [Candidatus Latescibacterota bacterium]